MKMATENGRRHYDFLHSVIEAAIGSGYGRLDESIPKAINYHATAMLHAEAGQYRTRDVIVRDGDGNEVYTPPSHDRVPMLMDAFFRTLNDSWDTSPPLILATWALSSINSIHPFINGNGRTARAVCYFIICVKLQGPLPGTSILPELIKGEYDRYIDGLKAADQGDYIPLYQLVEELLARQIRHGSTPC